MSQTQSRSELLALFRYGIIASLLSVPKGGGRLKREISDLAGKTWRHPDGQMVRYSFATIEEWYYDFARFGFAGLLPRKRKDQGSCRTLSTALQEELARVISSNIGMRRKGLSRAIK